MSNKNTVGRLREQSALADSGVQVVLATEDPELQDLVRSLRVVRFYPDFRNAEGKATQVFKVIVGGNHCAHPGCKNPDVHDEFCAAHCECLT